jgi:hypothetical protein
MTTVLCCVTFLLFEITRRVGKTITKRTKGHVEATLLPNCEKEDTISN